jgi:transposase
MKSQMSKPRHTREKYTEEYKAQALKLWRESGRSANLVSAELGIRPPLLYRWARAERVGTEPKAGGKPEKNVGELEREIARLREENAKLLEQRETLKKSLGILSEMPPRGMPGSKR